MESKSLLFCFVIMTFAMLFISVEANTLLSPEQLREKARNCMKFINIAYNYLLTIKFFLNIQPWTALVGFLEEQCHIIHL